MSIPTFLERLHQRAQTGRRAPLIFGITALILVVAQALVLFGDSEVAEATQIAVFIGLAAAYLAWRQEPERQLMLALALLPLVQLLSLSLPTRLAPTLQWFVMIGVPTYVLLGMAAYRLRLRPAEIGLRLTRWQPQARVVLLGAALAIPGYFILQPEPLVADPTPVNLLTAALIVAIFGGLLEEGLFRGVIQAVAERSLARRSIAVSAFATGLLYAASLDLRYMTFAVLVGIVFGTVVRRTGSLVGVGAGHAALLVGQLVLLPALLG
jgi:membrane protease YdiL (CAAX protease family)